MGFMKQGTPSPLLTTREVAAYFRVDDATIRRWADDGRLPHFRTPGGRRRFYAAAIEQMTAQQASQAAS